MSDSGIHGPGGPVTSRIRISIWQEQDFADREEVLETNPSG